jgi:hypothetical protein
MLVLNLNIIPKKILQNYTANSISIMKKHVCNLDPTFILIHQQMLKTEIST